MSKILKSRFFLIVPVLLLLMTLIIQPVYATEIPGNGIIGPDEVIDDDVMLSAENPSMLGTVNGMLVITGNHALIDGTVNGDVIAMGNYIEIGENAHITGNVFSGGYLIHVSGIIDGSLAGGSSVFILDENAKVERNLYYGGYSAEINKTASIGTDAYLGTYQTMHYGSIGRDLHIGAGALIIEGNIGRNAKIDVASPDNAQQTPFFMYSMSGQNQSLPTEAQKLIPGQLNLGLVISKSAEIGGNLTYVSPNPQTESIQVTPSAGTVYQTPVPNPDEQQNQSGRPIVFRNSERGTAAFITGMILTWVWRVVKAFVTLILIALLIFWLTPKKFEQSLQILREHPAKSFGYGLLAIVGGYILFAFTLVVLISFTAFLAIITFGTLGFYFFLIAFSCFFLVFALFLILTSMGSKILVAYFIGDWLVSKLSKTPVQGRVIPLMVGLLLYIIVGYVPILGFVVRTIMIIFGSGAIYLMLLSWWRSWRTPALPAE